MFKASIEKSTERFSNNLDLLQKMTDTFPKDSLDEIITCYTVALLPRNAKTDEIVHSREFNLGTLAGMALMLDVLGLSGDIKFTNPELFKSSMKSIGRTAMLAGIFDIRKQA